MLAGLEGMRWEQLLGAAAVAGIPNDEAVRLGTPEKLRARLVRAMADMVGCRSQHAPEVEEAVIGWLAQRWKVTPQGESLAVLEDRVFDRISEETARYLMPVWKVAACMALLGVPASRADELDFLEKVSTRLVPSAAARAEMRAQWESLSHLPSVTAATLLDVVRPDLDELAQRRELVMPTLSLCLVVALADSKLEREENQLYEGIAGRLGVKNADAAALRERINSTFWQVRGNIAPPNTEPPDQLRRNSLRAAHMTLEQGGILDSLEQQVRHGCLTGLHQTMFLDPDFQRGLKGWNRAPMLWPVGFAMGTLLYLKSRLHTDAHRNLTLLALMAHASGKQPAGS